MVEVVGGILGDPVRSEKIFNEDFFVDGASQNSDHLPQLLTEVRGDGRDHWSSECNIK